MKGKIPEGKGQFIHYLYRDVKFHGGVDGLVLSLIDDGFQWVAPKAQQGIWAFTGSAEGNWTQQELLLEFAESCRKHGLGFHIWGWIYLYVNGRSIINREAAKTVELCNLLQPLSYIVNKEVKSGEDENHLADSYMRQVKREIDIPIGFSSFKYPESHPEIPWEGFGDHVDYWAPQVYWQEDTREDGGVLQLRKSIAQHVAIQDLPLVPAGTCYPEGEWWTTVVQLIAFCYACKEIENVVGVNFWAHYYTKKHKPVLGEALRMFEWKERPSLPRIIKRAAVYQTRRRIRRALARQLNIEVAT
jgi:hypothetical protein